MYSRYFTPRSQLGSTGEYSLVASTERSELYGGTGKDILVGVGKRDYLHGGSDADIFTVKPSNSYDKNNVHELADFNPSEGDTLDIASVLNGKQYNYIGSKKFSGFKHDIAQVRLIRIDKLALSKSKRQSENPQTASLLSSQVQDAMTAKIGEIPEIKGRKFKTFKQVIQIDIDGDQQSDYDFVLGEKVSKADRKKLRLMNDESFITTSLPLRKASCSITQTGIPMLGSDHELVFQPIINLDIGEQVHTPSLGCPFVSIGSFGAEIPVEMRIGGKIGIKTGSLVGTTSLPEFACSYDKDLPLKPPLTGSAGIGIGLSAAAEVTDEKATNKEVGIELGVKSGTTINLQDGDEGFKDPFVTPFAETYAEPEEFDGKGIDVSITLRPYAEVLIGLGATLPGKDICTANLIQGDFSLSTPLTTTFTDLKDPSLTLGARINVNANVLRVDCGPISAIAKQFPLAEFDIMEAATGESALVLAGNNGVIQ